MSFLEKFLGQGQDQNPEMGPQEQRPEMEVPTEQVPEVGENVDLEVVNATLNKIKQEEREEEERDQQIEDIKRKPTIH